ncbi:putative ribonuclease H-like domain-containing protein [Tanacetum coccineum]
MLQMLNHSRLQSKQAWTRLMIGFQKLITLEVHGALISKEDINQKFLRSLPPSWNQIVLIMRNKQDIDEIDIDDLYNNLRVYEDKMKRTGPNWMFDLDFLTNSMNYIPVSVENQDKIPVEMLTLAAHEKPSESSSKVNDVQDSEDVADKEGQHQMTEDEQVLHDELEKIIASPQEATSFNKLSTGRSSVSTATTPYVSAASTPTGANAGESSFVYLGGKIPIDASTLPNADLPIDPTMPDLEDDYDAFSNDGIFNGAYDDENVGAVADFNNMDATINVSPIPTLRIHKDHPKDQILGDPKLAVQTRGKIQKDSSAQQALILVDLPFGKKEIGTKIEAIKLFLALTSYMGFTAYQMDVKSAFLYSTIEEEVYVHRPPGFVDLAYPNKVYKVIKALYGLHQAPRAWYETLSSFLMENGLRRGTIDKTLFIKKNKHDIMLVQVYVDDISFGSTKKSMCIEFEDCMHKRFQMSSIGELTFFLGHQAKQQPDGIFISQDKYVADILKKFYFWFIKTATTPIESNKPLVKDEDGEDVDVHVYRSMIGSLMYLTTSRPYIMFTVCAYARFQVTPKASHLNAVKRIFRYLKHQPKLGLWYPRDSPFELEVFSDSDYRGASLDRKSRIDIFGTLTVVGNVIKNPVAHSRTKHIEIRFHFIRDCYEKRLIEVIKIHTDSNVADLLTKGFDVTRFNFLVLKNVPVPLDHFPINALTSKVFSFMVKKGKHFLGNVTPLFESMLVQPTEDEGEASERKSEP